MNYPTTASSSNSNNDEKDYYEDEADFLITPIIIPGDEGLLDPADSFYDMGSRLRDLPQY